MSQAVTNLQDLIEQIEQVPETVADCLEPVFLPGYVQEEKCQITRQYLLPREREKCGLSEDQFDVDDFAITQLVAATSSEAGVSALKSRLGAMTRRAALAVAGGEGPVRVAAEDLPRWAELTTRRIRSWLCPCPSWT